MFVGIRNRESDIFVKEADVCNSHVDGNDISNSRVEWSFEAFDGYVLHH